MRRLWISFDLYMLHHNSQSTGHEARQLGGLQESLRCLGISFCLLMSTSLAHYSILFKSTFSSLFRFPRVSPGVESAPGLDAAAHKLNSICSIWHQRFTDLHRFTIFIEVPKFEAISSSDSFPLRCIRQLFWISVVQKLRISHGEGHRHRRR